MNQRSIEEELNKLSVDYDVVYMEETESTNDFGKIHYGEHHKNTIIVADSQTKGRGRLGRSFVSSRGKGIFMTILLHPDCDISKLSGITLVAAVAVSRAVDGITGIVSDIKWPNDIIVNKKKLCGILTEMKNNGSRAEYVLVGIGVNVYDSEFVEEIRDKGTSIFLETGKRDFGREEIIAHIVREFQNLWEIYLKKGNLEFLLDEYNSKLVNKNKEVLFFQGKEQKMGIQGGITKDGNLIVTIDGEEKEINSGEILIRGVEGYV